MQIIEDHGITRITQALNAIDKKCVLQQYSTGGYKREIAKNKGVRCSMRM